MKQLKNSNYFSGYHANLSNQTCDNVTSGETLPYHGKKNKNFRVGLFGDFWDFYDLFAKKTEIGVPNFFKY